MANQPATDKLRRETDRTTCRSCGRPLPADALFCGVCGAPAPAAGGRPCASCGQANPYDARFCSRCGASLTAGPPATPTGPPARRPGGDNTPWGQVALGGLGGLLLGSLLGRGRGGWGGYGDWDGRGGGWDAGGDGGGWDGGDGGDGGGDDAG